MHVLRAAEDLTGARAHLTLEEVGEGLLDDVADLGEIALPDPPDLDEGGTTLGVQTRAIDGGSHLASGSPASSSRSVMTPE